MDITTPLAGLSPQKIQPKTPVPSGQRNSSLQESEGHESPADQSRFENENGVVLTGPAFFRGDDEIRDIAAFTTESLDALTASQGL